MKWSRELVDVSIANCDECRTIDELFTIEKSYSLILKAMAMMEKENRQISGMIMPVEMVRMLELNRITSFECKSTSSFILFGVPSTTFLDLSDICCNSMYFLCDFFDDEKSSIVKILFKGALHEREHEIQFGDYNVKALFDFFFYAG